MHRQLLVLLWWWYVFSRRTSQLCFCKNSSQLEKRENAKTKLRKDKVLPRLTQQHRNAHTHQTVLRLQLGRLIGRLIYFHGTSAAADERNRKRATLRGPEKLSSASWSSASCSASELLILVLQSAEISLRHRRSANNTQEHC